MHKKSYFESFCLGRTRPQHFSCVLVKKKGAIAGKALVLNQVDHKDSKVGRGVCKDETRSQRAAKASPCDKRWDEKRLQYTGCKTKTPA